MNLITTTELRRKTSFLVNTLQKGEEVSLLHRSKIIGKIKPLVLQIDPLNSDKIQRLRKVLSILNLPKTTLRKRENNYRLHFVNKYG